MTLTSVIMVTYHTGPVLTRAIEAVLASTAPVELVLVNNGNPPEVEAKLAALAAAESRITWISGHGNVGFGVGCNKGARAAKGDFLLFLNPDSLLPADVLARLQAQVAALPRPFLAGARLLDKAGRDQRGCRRALLTPWTACVEALHLQVFFPKLRLNFHEAPLPPAIASVPAISGAFLFLTAADFWAIDGFDEDYFLHVEDLDFCWRFRRAGGEIYFAPDIVVTHIGGTSRVTSAFLEKHKARGFIKYFRKNFSAFYPAPVLWILMLAIWARLGVKLALARGLGRGK